MRTPIGPEPALARLSRDGRITIPAAMRKALGLESGTELKIMLTGGALRIAPVLDHPANSGSSWILGLYDEFAPVRAEIAAAGYSEDEVNDDIAAAIRAVRAEQR